jgi:hypothetical protein
MPYTSNKEIREAPAGYVPAKIDHATGHVKGPQCCGNPMADDGGCSSGCCDDYKCAICGHTVRTEWPD